MIPKNIRIEIKEKIAHNGKMRKIYWIWELIGNSWVFAMRTIGKSKSEAYDKYCDFFHGG